MSTAPPLPEPVAYIREWEGDVSDLGRWMIVGKNDECDGTAPWYAAFVAEQIRERDAYWIERLRGSEADAYQKGLRDGVLKALIKTSGER